MRRQESRTGVAARSRVSLTSPRCSLGAAAGAADHAGAGAAAGGLSRWACGFICIALGNEVRNGVVGEGGQAFYENCKRLRECGIACRRAARLKALEHNLAEGCASQID